MWTILKVLHLVRAISTDCKSELFNRQGSFPFFFFFFFVLVFLFVFFVFFKKVFSLLSLFSCYSQKNRWRLFVRAGDDAAALKVPTSLKHPHPKPSGLLVEFKKKTPTPAEKGAAACRCCCFSARQTRAKADHQWRCSSYTGEVDKGPFRVVQDGWEHAKLSPLSPRTEIFPGSQNSRPTGEALSECDAAGGVALPIFGSLTLPVGQRCSAVRAQPQTAAARLHSLAPLSLLLRPYMWWVFIFFNNMENRL